MKESEKLKSAKECVDSVVRSWNRTSLSDLEKWYREEWIIDGITHLAMYLLTNSDYQALKEYIWTEYGYNVGGTSGDNYELSKLQHR